MKKNSMMIALINVRKLVESIQQGRRQLELNDLVFVVNEREMCYYIEVRATGKVLTPQKIKGKVNERAKRTIDGLPYSHGSFVTPDGKRYDGLIGNYDKKNCGTNPDPSSYDDVPF